MARHPIVPPIALAAILGLGSVLARPAPVPAAPADPVAVIAAVKGRVDIGSSHG